MPESQWISEVRQALASGNRNFFAINPARYWFDFLLSAVLAYGAASIYLVAPLGSWPQLIAFPITVFWLYRLGSLIHEVAHLPHHEMQVFKVVWNLVVGVLTLSPSPFFTRHHRDHHSMRMYGTPQDPEYSANVCESGNWWSIGLYAVQIALFPLLVFLRFLLVPLTYLHPKFREFVLRRGSSLTFNWRYERKLTDFDRWSIAWLELLCCIRAAFILAVVFLGWSEWTRPVLLYLLALATIGLNQMRQLADHHLESDGDASSVDAHIRDSCNHTGRDFLTWLFFPFAIRYHALHHLFPSMPYHNLAAAHSHLRASLAADSPYHSLEETGWWSVARHTFKMRQVPRVA